MFKLHNKSIAYTFAAMLFVLDRFLKLALENGYLSGPREIIGSFFRFNFTQNANIAFSLPFNQSLIIIIDSIVILFLISYIVSAVLSRKYKHFELIPLTFLSFGAISNLLDRLRFGYVVDYLDLKYFTVFNLADIMIVASICYLLIRLNKNTE